jgi:GntR family transcriptional regulator, transcriptional repressor for pyruvate dehydrogenase complex
MFKPVKSTTIFEAILDQIRNLLVTKQLTVGQKMPSEIELAESLSISRSSLREALGILRMLGMIEAKTGEGTVIRQASPENLKKVMSLVAVSRGIATEDLFEMRTMLEIYSVRSASVRRTEQDLESMRHWLAQMDNESANQEREVESDYQFHRSIVEASKNSMLIMQTELISGLLEEQIRSTRIKFANSGEILAVFQKQHWDIYRAIEKRKMKEAEAAMLEHMTYAQQEMHLRPAFIE